MTLTLIFSSFIMLIIHFYFVRRHSKERQQWSETNHKFEERVINVFSEKLETAIKQIEKKDEVKDV